MRLINAEISVDHYVCLCLNRDKLWQKIAKEAEAARKST